MVNESGDTPRNSGSDKPRRNSSSSRPPSGSGRSSSDRPRSDRPKSDRPSSSRPPSGSGRSSSERPRSDRPSSSRPPSGSGRSGGSSGSSSDRNRSERPGRGGSARFGKDEQRDDRRIELKNEPAIPEEVLNETVDPDLARELSSLSKENAERAAQHLLAAAFYVDTDPRRAHLHGVAASARAGRVGRVREVAGYAAYHAREFEIAIRELRAANRISGDGSMWPVLADSERGIGRPEKAVEMAKDPQVKLLDIDGQIEMKIVIAGARRDLKQVDAAVATLKCAELENETASWAARLRYAYADALEASGDHKNAQKWFVKSAEIDINQETDANERIKSN
jgi:hypothetical protein